MSYTRETLETPQTYAWTWHVMPVLVAAAALSALFLPPGGVPAEAAAAAPMSIEAEAQAMLPMLLVPSPQPGEGEPELMAADLPQSY